MLTTTTQTQQPACAKFRSISKYECKKKPGLVLAVHLAKAAWHSDRKVNQKGQSERSIKSYLQRTNPSSAKIVSASNSTGLPHKTSNHTHITDLSGVEDKECHYCGHRR